MINSSFSKIILFFAILFHSFLFFGQEKPYWKEIEEFKKLDSQQSIPKNPILFLGSSSFTKWTDVNAYFPDKTIINRAFGGSRLLDLNNYANDLLNPFKPKQIVIYCGENDVATNNPTADEVFGRFKIFLKKIREKYPKVPVAYVSIKYSPSREQYWPTIKQLNEKIKLYLKTQKRAQFIDITQVMNDNEGKVRSDLFLEDRLHMKPEGYKLWAKVMAPYLK